MRSMPYAKGWHKVRQKPSGKYEARWADENGDARGKCFMTKAQATRHAEDMARNVGDAAVGLAVLHKELRAAADMWLATYTDAGTLRIYTRHIDKFILQMPDVKLVGHLTEDVIIAYDKLLTAEVWPNGRARHNSGGRRHILKSIKAFTKFCTRRKWLAEDPFLNFKMPKSTFEGRALDAGESAKLFTPDPRFEVDEHLRDVAILARETTLRSETIWSLTPMDFRAPDQLRVKEQKDQELVWVPLTDTAAAIIRRRLHGRKASQRLFDYWPSVDAMRQAFRKKARREGLAGVRLHDAGKVTRVSELLAAGYTPKELEHITNTNWKTLMSYYAKADRMRTFEKYKLQSKRLGSHTNIAGGEHADSPRVGLDLPRTYIGPETGVNAAETRPQVPMDAITPNEQNVAKTSMDQEARRDILG